MPAVAMSLHVVEPGSLAARIWPPVPGSAWKHFLARADRGVYPLACLVSGDGQPWP
jgi:hypothetical protein